MVIEKKPALEFTEAAASKLHEVLKEQDALSSYLRIAVSSTPQGGIEYVFGLEEKPAESDQVVQFGALKAVVDEDSMPLLEGSSVDYVEGFQRSGFVISNPNFRGGGCACGGGGCGGGGHGQAEAEAGVGEAAEAAAGGCACGGHGHGGHGQAESEVGDSETAEAGAGGCACGGGGCGGHGR
jgi:iron-sulfur cluster insertion protein